MRVELLVREDEHAEILQTTGNVTQHHIPEDLHILMSAVQFLQLISYSIGMVKYWNLKQ
jgi:hypothetical protein